MSDLSVTKVAFRRNVTKYVEKEKSKTKQITAGFYTESAMAKQLNLDP